MQKTNTVVKFIKDVRSEMKFVKWPTRKMIIGSTIAVLVISIIVGAYLGALDLGLKKVLAYLVNMF